MQKRKHPRPPTADELEQLVGAVAERTEYMPSEEEVQQARDLVAQAYIAVFEDYVADGSEHQEKLISVVWNIGSDYYEVYAARDGYAELVPQNKVIAEV